VTSPESGSSRWAAREGLPFPFGPTKIEEDDAYNFALYSKHSEKQVRSAELAGKSIRTILTRALGNNAPVGGLTVITGGGWFAARPSGTEDIYKIHAQSFRGAGHLHRILAETQTIVSDALAVSPQKPR